METHLKHALMVAPRCKEDVKKCPCKSIKNVLSLMIMGKKKKKRKEKILPRFSALSHYDVGTLKICFN